MTVSTTISKVTYTGNGSATVFSFAFKILEDSDLEVVVTTIATGAQSVKVLDTDYSVSGAGDAGGGSITYPLSGSALASTQKITLRRVLPRTQETDIPNQGAFYPETIEDQFDRAAMLIQELDDAVARAITIPPSDTTGTDLELPPAADRAGYLLGFDDDGNVSISLAASSVSAYIATLLDDVDAATARATLGLGSVATQAASALAVTGGAIDNATVGATTPSTGRFTTLQARGGSGAGYGYAPVVMSLNGNGTGSPADTNENNLHSYTVPASTLASTSDMIRFFMGFRVGSASSATQRIRAYIGSTVIADTGASDRDSKYIQIEGLIARTGATTGVAHYKITVGDSTPTANLVGAVSLTGITETWANALALKATVQLGASPGLNDVIQDFSTVEYLRVS